MKTHFESDETSRVRDPEKARTRTRTVGPDDETTGGRQRGGSIRGREGPRDDANARAIGETATRLGEASFG
jgi:hypothetical protein